MNRLQQTAPTLSSDQAVEMRAEKLVAQMTLVEKLQLLMGSMPHLVPIKQRPPEMLMGAGFVPGVPRLGIPPLNEADAGLGVANFDNRRVDDEATALPSGLALASTWSPLLARLSGEVVGKEARAKGFNVLLGGGVNLTREARNGRNFEYFGEDPLLSGIMGGHSIAGVQSAEVICTLKHFAFNDQETGRNVLSVNMDLDTARSTDLLAFEIAHEIGRPGAVMSAYNKWNGVYSSENDLLLNGILRNEWGFNGWVMSDWGGVHSYHAIERGLDQQSGKELDAQPYFGDALRNAVLEGEIKQEAIDTSVKRILRTLINIGVMDNPVAPGGDIDVEANAQIAKRTADEGIVLLKNSHATLPLSDTGKKVVVIGGHADLGVLSGGGSSQVRPFGGPSLEVRTNNSYDGTASLTHLYVNSSPVAALRECLPNTQIDFLPGDDLATAVETAARAETVVIFATRWASEGFDAADLKLGSGQDEMIEAVARAHPRVVVVLETDGPVEMNWIPRVNSVIQAWFPGQCGGQSIAEVLVGAVNPSGRLPITFPSRVSDLPNPELPGWDVPRADEEDRKRYGKITKVKPFDVAYPEGRDVGYKWFARRGYTPLFPFGHGLSYSSFAYRDAKFVTGESAKISFVIENIGSRHGIDTPQVYIEDDGIHHLIGWTRVQLNPGESQLATITLDLRPVSTFYPDKRSWSFDCGERTVWVSKSATQHILRLEYPKLCR